MPKAPQELQKLTVAALRDLAKKRLGPGTSKLRTKAQLVAALERGTLAAAPPAKRGKAAAKAQPSIKEAQKKPIRSPPAKTAPRSRKAALESAAAPDLPVRAPAPEPISEPVVALPLDARTLLVRWKPVPVRGKDERWELEVFGDGELAFAVEVQPRTRQVRVPSLAPGPVYRAQLVARAPNGGAEVIGSLSRPVVFFGDPQPVPSPERFVSYSWSDPAASVQGAQQPVPGSPLPHASELAALGAAAAAQLGRTVTSPLEWFQGSGHPTSFAH